MLYDPLSGRELAVYSDYPCLCFYNGGGLGGNAGKNGAIYPRFGAVVLEPKYFPNAVNYAHFGDIILKKGETKYHKIAYDFNIR